MREIIRQKILDSQADALPRATRRDVRLPRIRGKAIAVIGPRRAGKTTFLWQVMGDRMAAGHEREGLLYFNFEDERLADMTAAELHWIVEEYYTLHPQWRDRKRAVFLFDEIQIVPGWETFVRRMMDTERVDVFLSGSSARLLSREVATAMRGRAMETLVFPFSFREFLRHRAQEPDLPADRLPKAGRSVLDKALREYLTCGGYPEATVADQRDRFELLRGYVDTMLLRDAIERHAVSNPLALRWMARQLLCAPAGAFSVHKFHRDLSSQNIHVAKDTLHAYLAYLEDAFVVRMVSRASESVQQRNVNPRKAYPIDPGLIPVFDRSGRANLGHALETAVALELERRGAQTGYVRTATGREVDFLARYPNGEQDLIQVCASMDEPETRRRETQALLDAAEEHPRARPLLVTLSAGKGPAPPAPITPIPAPVWLLENP